MRILLATFAVAVLASASPAISQEDTPPACRQDAAGQVDWGACAAAAAVGTPLRSLALINLGSRAFEAGDYAEAARLYDEAQPKDGRKIFSDARFHAFRSAAYRHVGRHAEALEQATFAAERLSGKIETPAFARPDDQTRERLYALILPALKTGEPVLFQSALASFRALPAADWISHANRAAVLNELGETQAALAANAEAMKTAPDHPAVLNNACYILTDAGRAAEGLPYCQRAVAAAPGVAAVHHSLAATLAALHRCVEAEAALTEARRLDPSSSIYKAKLACTAA